jgi:choline-sulfatase
MAQDRPNILMIMTDQQSATMMGCAGNAWLKTPSMDAIAARGTRFDLAFCTNPVCIPSRFSLFTGRYPSEIGMRSNFWKDAALTPAIVQSGLGHAVRAAGYEVAYGGKEHLPKTDARELGFDYLCKDERDELAETCAGFLRKKHDKPFFLVASFINPHDICHLAINDFGESGIDLILKQKCVLENESVARAARNPAGVDDEEFFARHCPPLPDNYLPQVDEPEAVSELLDQRTFRRHAKEKWGERGWRRHRWAYCRLTEEVDRQVGVVLDALREAGLDQDTVVIFTSDHGDNDGAHQLEHKDVLYEEATRIPFILCDPAAPARGAVDREHLVCNGLDLFPTVCDYAGATVPAGLRGTSLRPLVTGAGPDDGCRGHVLIESEFGFGIRTRDFLYALYDQGANREQLYDLRRDPGQTRNFVADPGCADVLARHRALARQEGIPNVPEGQP